MHDRRNFVLVILAGIGLIWAVIAWFILPGDAPLATAQRVVSLGLHVVCAAWERGNLDDLITADVKKEPFRRLVR